MSRPLPSAELAEAISLAGDWSPLRGARLFITGGTGFFGKWLLETLGAANQALELGVVATVLSRDPQRFLDAMPHLAQAPWLRLQQGDVLNFTFPTGAFSHILHGAASSDARDYQQEPAAMRRILVDGTQRALDFTARQPAPRLLLISSGAVYGPQTPGLTHFPEDYPLPPDTDDPAQAYAQGKREAERLAMAAAATHSFPCPIARCFAFAGPHLPLDQHFAFGNFIRNALAGGPIRVAGDGTSRRSYLYASEVAAWLWAMMLRGNSGPYHVGSEADVSIRELAETIAAAVGAAVEIAEAPQDAAPISRYVPVVRRIPVELGLSQTVSLRESIARTLNWNHDHCTPGEA